MFTMTCTRWKSANLCSCGCHDINRHIVREWSKGWGRWRIMYSRQQSFFLHTTFHRMVSQKGPLLGFGYPLCSCRAKPQIFVLVTKSYETPLIAHGNVSYRPCRHDCPDASLHASAYWINTGLTRATIELIIYSSDQPVRTPDVGHTDNSRYFSFSRFKMGIDTRSPVTKTVDVSMASSLDKKWVFRGFLQYWLNNSRDAWSSGMRNHSGLLLDPASLVTTAVYTLRRRNAFR